MVKRNLRHISRTLNHLHGDAVGLAGHHGTYSLTPRERGAQAATGAPARLLIVDGHEIARAGVRKMLDQAEHIKVVGEAGTIAATIEETRRLTPDVILMESRLPDGSGIDACRNLRASCPGTRILFFTSFSDDNAVISAFRAGASGFLLKETSGRELSRAIEVIAKGQSILDPALTLRMLAHICRLPVSPSTNICAKLSAQEKRVLELVVEGKTNKEIGVSLGLSEKTVKNYLRNAYKKLHVHRRAEATACFLRHSRDTVSPSLADLGCPLSAPPAC